MNIYAIKVPLIIESKGNFDKHDFSSSEKVKFSYHDVMDEFTYELKSDEKESYIIFKNIKSLNLTDCMSRIELNLNLLLPLCSLIIQSQNSNQHYSHIKLNYKISQYKMLNENIIQTTKIEKNKIHIKDNFGLRDSMHIQTVLNVDFSDLNTLINMKNDTDFRFLIDCYYRSIASTESITKFYNAFTVIEFVENYFKNDINTTKLLNNEELDNIDQYIKTTIANDKSIRISNRVKSTLKNATFENRTQKLILILNSIFKIFKLKQTMIEIDVDKNFIDLIIETRNSLYHGKKLNDKNEISKISLNLIYLVQNILLNWKLVKA